MTASEGRGIMRILQSLTGRSSEFYNDATKILVPPPPPSLSLYLYVPKLVDQPTNRIITNQETRKLDLLAQLNELTFPIISTSWIFSGN